GRAPLRGRRGGGDDVRMGVAEQERAPRADEVDVPDAVGVDDVGALTTVEEPGDAADRPERTDRGVHAAGDHPVRTCEQLLGPAHAPDATDAPPSLTAARPPRTLAG